MSAYPPPQPGYGPPPPGYGTPRRKGNANGVIAAAVAGLVIVIGVVTTVLLVTSDSNKDVRASLGSGSNRPTGSPRPTGSLPNGRGSGGQRPTGQNIPTIATPSFSPPGGSSADLGAATSAGSQYFDDLEANFYFSARGQWCQSSAFPLTQADVDAVTSAYSLGSAQGSSTTATMQGHVSLDDGRSGSLTISLRPEDSDGISWCITAQSNLS